MTSDGLLARSWLQSACPMTEQFSTASFSYQYGGSLAWNDPTYIQRGTDKTLAALIQQGKFAAVLAPRQMGKSSLRIRTRHQFASAGYQCVSLQANQLIDYQPTAPSISDATASGQQWILGFIATIWEGLTSTGAVPFLQWVHETSELCASERLERFVETFLSDALQQGPVLLLIDEVDALLQGPCATELFEWIARCYHRRTTEPLFSRLNFVIFGTALPSDIPYHEALFSHGSQVTLLSFSRAEVTHLRPGFNNKLTDVTTLIDAVFNWTKGQPFLTQKLCGLLSGLIDSFMKPIYGPVALSSRAVHQWVEQAVRSHIIEDWPTKDDPVHLRAISDRINASPNAKALLMLYKQVLSGKAVVRTAQKSQAELLLSGIVVVEAGHLQVANDIYRQTFKLH
ncbi:MAG: AAA-like domain-containing protein [Cyanobacteria bacterium J06627_28]